MVVEFMLIEDSFIGIVSSWLIRENIEDCISQEKPVIIQDACPGRLLMDTYGNSQATLLKSGCTRHSSQEHVCSRL